MLESEGTDRKIGAPERSERKVRGFSPVCPDVGRGISTHFLLASGVFVGFKLPGDNSV